MAQASLDFGDDYLPFTTESKVRTQLTADGVKPLLWRSIMEPWADFQEYRRVDPNFRDLEEGEAAWWLHTQIKRRAIALCEEQPELGLKASPRSSEQFHLTLRNELIVVLKKLTRRWCPTLRMERLERSNYQTDGNRDFWQQRREEGYPDANRIIVGYEPIKALTEVAIHVGYPHAHGRHFEWIYQMPDQTSAVRKLMKQRLRIAAADGYEEERKGWTLKPRKDSEERETK